jgi:DNA-directed RNA polymerase subunit RPC12/RpoP
MNACLKFACIYCGRRMEYESSLGGRHLPCPACQHRIAIPMTQVRQQGSRLLLTKETWDTWVPMPTVEFPRSYSTRMDSTAVLTGQAR